MDGFLVGVELDVGLLFCVFGKVFCGNFRIFFAKSLRSSNSAAVVSLAEIVGITKLVNARIVKMTRIVKHTQISSIKVPVVKITLRPCSVRTKNC